MGTLVKSEDPDEMQHNAADAAYCCISTGFALIAKIKTTEVRGLK